MKKYLIVGAGFSGAVIARELVERLDCQVTMIDQRNHIAGNCYTYRDTKSQVMIHAYGPHIFHTNNEQVWTYISRFTQFGPYVHRVKAITPRGTFLLPINLCTINQFFGKILNPSEAQKLLTQLGDTSIHNPQNFEEQALRFLGRELYENFFYGYTRKQWGCEPRELSASILKRLPVRFSYNDNYFTDSHQGIPLHGYTEIIKNILDHPKIAVQLNTSFQHDMRAHYDHVFYTGPIDAFFEHRLGRLSYRTMVFERIDADGDFQGNAQINYTDIQIPFTRICEHKHFTPWESHEKTVAFKEFSKETSSTDSPYYPKNLSADQELYQKYLKLAEQEKNLSFTGRLGTYRYLDMDETIAEALLLVDKFTGQHL